jgi:regulator of sirC expression with transglutaminase-like and TPR domain
MSMAADPELLRAFAGLAADPHADASAAALLVARLIEPGLDVPRVRDSLDQLAAMCPATLEPWEYLGRLGFRGNSADYGALANSRLDRVLETRQGIPITLAVVLLHVARAAGRAATGVNFPGHFLVDIEGVLVDPFVMAPAAAEDWMARLPDTLRNRPSSAIFAPAPPRAIALRMLNNLKALYARDSAWHSVLDVIDAQIAAAPGDVGLYLERGELWLRLGARSAARDAFREVLARTVAGDPDAGAVRERAAARLAALPDAGEVLH